MNFFICSLCVHSLTHKHGCKFINSITCSACCIVCDVLVLWNPVERNVPNLLHYTLELVHRNELFNCLIVAILTVKIVFLLNRCTLLPMHAHTTLPVK